jgi:hypothetical protein
VLEPNGVLLVEASGRVHEHVDPPVQGVRLINEASDGGLIGNVELMGRGGAAVSDDLGRNGLGFALRSPVADEGRGPLPAEPARDRSAQRAAGTGHKCDALRESLAVVPGGLHNTPSSIGAKRSHGGGERATARTRCPYALPGP